MPFRRRSAQTAAASLPPRRLPIGTPQLPSSVSPPRSYSAVVGRISSRVLPTHVGGVITGPNGSIVQPSETDMTAYSRTPTNHPPLSIAQNKLIRQQKRIEEDEAKLCAPAPCEKQRQTSRPKGRQWRPFDLAGEVHRPLYPDTSQENVYKTRINTFGLLADDGATTGSVSDTSHQASECLSDREHQDSGLALGGFQVCKSRRTRRNAGDLAVSTNDRVEEQQTTVEANFDTREIYEVFGNALPGPEFLDGNVGNKSGQVQFLQHPNGDVSAQQWSQDAFEWQNIGQFSNIRKRVEGQLASERLRGETAHQTLQRNTLPYFKTISKQREATAMDEPFGPREIQVYMPEPCPDAGDVSPASKELTEPPETPEREDRRCDMPVRQADDRKSLAESSAPQAPNQPSAERPLPTEPNADRVHLSMAAMQQPSRDDDPFTAYTRSSLQQMQDQHPCSIQPLRPPSYPNFCAPQRQQGVDRSFHSPQIGNTDWLHQGPGAQAYFAERVAFANKFQQWQQHQARGHQTRGTPGSNHHGYFNSLTVPGTGTGRRAYMQAGQSRQGQTAANNDLTALRSKHISPFNGSHSERLDQLMKIGDAAKERSLSQSNIRTVLHDPLQSANSPEQHQLETEKPLLGAQNDLPVIRRSVQPVSSFNPLASNFFPAILTQERKRSTSHPVSPIQNDLKDSSPDTQWKKRPYEHSTPLVTTSEAKPTSEIFPGPFLTTPFAVDSSAESTNSGVDGSTRAYDDELRNWWTSGNRFSRQEDFFRSIKNAEADASSFGASECSAPYSNKTFNDTITRLLIPVQENLSAYVQGPEHKRRDYFTPWSKPPTWAVDRSPEGNKSFYDENWVRPPARVGRDSRYRPVPAVPSLHGRFRSSTSTGWAGSAGTTCAAPVGSPTAGGLDRRFGFGGRY